MNESHEPIGDRQKLAADRKVLLETVERLTDPTTPLAKQDVAAQIARAKAEIDRLQVDIDKFDAG